MTMAGTVIKIAEHDKDQETAEMTTDGEHTAMILIVVRIDLKRMTGIGVGTITSAY